jgi:hypothetical protein
MRFSISWIPIAWSLDASPYKNEQKILRGFNVSNQYVVI